MRANKNKVTQEISYATTAKTRAGRIFIRSVENLTGRIGLIRKARGYDVEVANGRNIWEVILERYRLELDVAGGSLDNIPRDGPVIVVANHPFGILDGLTLGHILSIARGDFRILAHQIFRRAAELDRIILPVSFDTDKAAMRTNVDTRKVALKYLKEGGCVGIFPGGSVSTSLRPFGHPMDPSWRRFTARLIAKSGAQVVPVFFEGHNSRLFQIASRINDSLRKSLLINEFKHRVGKSVRIVVGEPVPRESIEALTSDPRELMRFLREETYKLSPVPLADLGNGYELDEVT